MSEKNPLSTEEKKEFTELMRDYDQIKDRLFLKALNKECGAPLAQDFLSDVVLLPSIKIKEEEKNCWITADVMPGLLKYWGLELDEIIRDAMANMKKDWNYLIKNGIRIGETNVELFYLNDSDRNFSANVLFMADVLADIRMLLDEDYYVFPVSIHEVLIAKCSDTNPLAALALMEFMAEKPGDDDYLSSRLMIYTKEKGIGAFDYPGNKKELQD